MIGSVGAGAGGAGGAAAGGPCDAIVGAIGGAIGGAMGGLDVGGGTPLATDADAGAGGGAEAGGRDENDPDDEDVSVPLEGRTGPDPSSDSPPLVGRRALGVGASGLGCRCGSAIAIAAIVVDTGSVVSGCPAAGISVLVVSPSDCADLGGRGGAASLMPCSPVCGVEDAGFASL